MNCEYVRDYYGVSACVGRIVVYRGRKGVISADRGNYIGVTFDDEKPGTISTFHPPTDDLKYGGMGKVRKMTRSQKRYQDWQCADSGITFAEWLGIRPRVI